MEAVELIGRLLFVAIFLNSGITHFRMREGMVAYMRSSGGPAPELAVPLSGLTIFAGGVLIAIGAWPDLGAALIAAFLLPAAYWMHAYWKVDDPQQRTNQHAHFMKNVSLAGAALALLAFYNMAPGDGWHLTGPLFS
jgi:putative oxidoreductase